MGAHELIQKLNSLRKQVLLYRYFPLKAYMVALLLAIPAQIRGTKADSRVTILLLAAATMMVVLTANDGTKVKKEYKTLYKEELIKSLIETMLDDAYYNWEGGLSSMEVATFGLAKLGNRFKTQDFLSGSYKGVHFRQADVTIANEMVVNDEKYYEIYFTGRMFEFTFKGKGVQNVKVLSNSYNSNLNLGDEIIDMESYTFNNAFDVYSPDPVDAFYILTPQVMERLKKLHEKYDKIGFRFGQGRLCVAISGLNAFDADCKEKLTYVGEYERVKKDIQVIKDIVEIVGLMNEEEPSTV